MGQITLVGRYVKVIDGPFRGRRGKLISVEPDGSAVLQESITLALFPVFTSQVKTID